LNLPRVSAKRVWWVFIVSLTTGMILARREYILGQSPTPLDIIIFLVWIALLLAPIFQQVSLFGLTFKKEIESLKSEVKDQLVSLRSEIQASVAFQAQISPVFVNVPPGDAQLPAITPAYRKILEEDMKQKGIRKPITKETLPKEVPEDAIFLFGIRYQIENELRRISGDTIDIEHRRGVPFLQVMRTLVDQEVLDPRLTDVLRDVYSICSAAVHGGRATRQQISFVRDLAPELLASLKAIGH